MEEAVASSASAQCKKMADLDAAHWGLCYTIHMPHVVGWTFVIVICVLKMFALVVCLAVMLGLAVQHVQYHLCAAAFGLCSKTKFIWKQLRRISFDFRESWFYFVMRLRLNRLKGEDAWSAFCLALTYRYYELRIAIWECRHGHCCCRRWVRALLAFRLIAQRNYPTNYFNPDNWPLRPRIRARFQRDIFRSLFRKMHVFVVCCCRRMRR